MKWYDYETAYGKAVDVPDYLVDLFSTDQEKAFDATHQLWCGLTHQHAFISSAALPTYPFLRSGLVVLNDKLKSEILDILSGFAMCTGADYYEQAKTSMQSWEKKLRENMLKDLPLYEELRHHPDELIAAFAEDVVSCLQADKTSL